MSNADSAALWDRLYRELVRAEAEHYRIQEESTRLLVSSNSGIPAPDGLYRRIQAAKQATAAFDNYQCAVERFRAFVDEGIVPADLLS